MRKHGNDDPNPTYLTLSQAEADTSPPKISNNSRKRRIAEVHEEQNSDHGDDTSEHEQPIENRPRRQLPSNDNSPVGAKSRSLRRRVKRVNTTNHMHVSKKPKRVPFTTEEKDYLIAGVEK